MTDTTKKTIKKITKIAGTVALYLSIFAVVWLGIGFILMPKSYEDLGGEYYFAYHSIFEEDKDSIDVMFSGNSNTFKSCIPIEFYNSTGATCYNIGGSAQSAQAMEARIKKVLKRQSPKLIIFDVDCLYDTNTFFTGSNAYRILPLIAPVFYHNAWSKLSFSSFKLPKDDKNFMKGYIALYETYGYQISDDYMKSDTKKIKPLAKSVLKNMTNIYNICKDRDIDMLFISAPSPATWTNEKHNGIQQLADEWGIEYLDMNMPDSELGSVYGFDYYLHIADAGYHCNFVGAKLVTQFVSDYVNKHYAFEDRRVDKNYSKWNKQYQEYKVYTAKKQSEYLN